MIIIATHGRGGFSSTFLGSVADRVARGAECPVLLVPATTESVVHGPVLVALDGSPESEVALAHARAMAQHLSADVVLVSAYRMPPPVGVEFSYYSPSMLDSFKAATEEYLQKVAVQGEQAYTVQGPAASAITETATQINSGLVVMASSGKGLAERITLGTTTGRVMHSLHRPLLIVPAGE
jgi:nucleotide-binding universal stress UspA family protein